MKNGNPISLDSPNALKAYILASRPKTWSASLSPVLIGAVLAAQTTRIEWSVLFLTLFFSLLIQIGTNYANDYFDFVKGTDTAERKGPKRAVQQGWIAPQSMLSATGIIFGTSLFFAFPLMLRAGPWGFAIASLCVLFGVIYTGGPKPLGYLGLGEVLVLIFFGPVAGLGSYFLQTGEVSSAAFLASVAPGLLSSAILTANNLRDERTDRIANKRTLVVRFGARVGQWLYTSFIVSAFLIPILLVSLHNFPFKLLAASFVLAFAPLRKVFQSKETLQETSLLLVAYTAAFCFSLIF